MKKDKHIVVIGGGTGVYMALIGLKRYCHNLTAVVSMADDGGSSGRLRDDFGHLPPGDTRRSLIALSTDREVNHTLRALFEYRFEKGFGLNGHSFGNLFLTALTELMGSNEKAIEEAARLLNVRGRVLPVTTENVRLHAELEDGTIIMGESNIDVRTVKSEVGIQRVYLAPGATVYPPAAEAIRNADVVVLGPGDLYSSLIPNLLVKGVPEAIRDCKGARIYVCNLMTKHGETDGFTASTFVAEVVNYLGGPGALDYAVVNSYQFPLSIRTRYAGEYAAPVEIDLERLEQQVLHVVLADVAMRQKLVRHAPGRLARLVLEIAERSSAQPSEDIPVPAASGAAL
ncbi:MAG: YvcK family protein [Chloroflexi bacterium]|nr:YvcK family protein [Chloroflexota bacterium]